MFNEFVFLFFWFCVSQPVCHILLFEADSCMQDENKCFVKKEYGQLTTTIQPKAPDSEEGRFAAAGDENEHMREIGKESLRPTRPGVSLYALAIHLRCTGCAAAFKKEIGASGISRLVFKEEIGASGISTHA